MGAIGQKRVHASAAVVGLALWALAAWSGWLESVVFVSHVSMAALVYAALSAYQSTRTEVKQDAMVGPDGPMAGGAG